MAPRAGVISTRGDGYCDDFSTRSACGRGLFIHELVHVWQVQTMGDWYLVTRRMPWARYDYALKPGWPLDLCGIEQQAEIVRTPSGCAGVKLARRRPIRATAAGRVSVFDRLA